MNIIERFIITKIWGEIKASYVKRKTWISIKLKENKNENYIVIKFWYLNDIQGGFCLGSLGDSIFLGSLPSTIPILNFFKKILIFDPYK